MERSSLEERVWVFWIWWWVGFLIGCQYQKKLVDVSYWMQSHFHPSMHGVTDFSTRHLSKRSCHLLKGCLCTTPMSGKRSLINDPCKLELRVQFVIVQGKLTCTPYLLIINKVFPQCFFFFFGSFLGIYGISTGLCFPTFKIPFYLVKLKLVKLSTNNLIN